jgi:hypothetical protein
MVAADQDDADIITLEGDHRVEGGVERDPPMTVAPADWIAIVFGSVAVVAITAETIASMWTRRPRWRCRGVLG